MRTMDWPNDEFSEFTAASIRLLKHEYFETLTTFMLS